MAFAEGSIKATTESVACQIHAVYATQFSHGDPLFDLEVIEQNEKLIITLTYGACSAQVIHDLLDSSELSSFKSSRTSLTSSRLEINSNANISPYGYYITDLFNRTGGNITTSNGNTFRIVRGVIKFSLLDLDATDDDIWVSRKEFIDLLAAI